MVIEIDRDTHFILSGMQVGLTFGLLAHWTPHAGWMWVMCWVLWLVITVVVWAVTLLVLYTKWKDRHGDGDSDN